MNLNLQDGVLTLRPFEEQDLSGFAALHADEAVMADLGGPISADEAKDKLAGFMKSFETYGYSRLVALWEGDFAGYVGVTRTGDDTHALGAHDEIGWRILPRFWGKGLATRAAKLALSDTFDRVGLPEVLAYTGPDNLRSQAVMSRLGLTRVPELDFDEHYPPIGTWHGLVWRVTAQAWQAGL